VQSGDERYLLDQPSIGDACRLWVSPLCGIDEHSAEYEATCSVNYVEISETLIDRWCDRRALSPLRYLLNAWPPNGLADGVELLRAGLDKARALGRGQLTPEEEELIADALNQIDKALADGRFRRRITRP
jgi:hypothetical protein